MTKVENCFFVIRSLTPVQVRNFSPPERQSAELFGENHHICPDFFSLARRFYPLDFERPGVPAADLSESETTVFQRIGVSPAAPNETA